jgi:tetratricopeptide (TPR) repeat protein
MLEDIAAAEPGGQLAAVVGIALTRCYREAGDFGRAISSGEAIMQRLADRGHERLPDYLRLAVTVSTAYAEQGDLGHAIRMVRRSLAAAEDLASPEALAAAYWNASLFEGKRGNVTEAVTLANKALVLLENGESNRNIARLRTQLASYLLLLDDPDVATAQELLDTAARELTWSSASPADHADNMAARARALAMAGHYRTALDLLDELPEITRISCPIVAAECLTLRADILVVIGDVTEALVCYGEAMMTLELVGADRAAQQVWFALGQAYRGLGDLGKSSEAFERAAGMGGATRLRLGVPKVTAVPDQTGARV